MKKTTFIGDVLKLVSGTTVAQLITIAAAPLLTRLYSPEEMGVLNVFVSFVSTISVISCLRYEMAIMLPEKDEEAASLFWGSMGIAGLISVLMIPAVILVKRLILPILHAEVLAPYVWLLPVSVFFGGVLYGHPSLNGWATRLKHFGKLAIARVVATGSAIFLQLIAGLIGYGSSGILITTTVFGGALSAVSLGVQLWSKDGRFFIRTFNFGKILQGLKRYRKFPLFDSWAMLINNLSWLLPSFLLPVYFSLTEVGLYSLTSRILALPMALIGGAIGQVFFQRAAKAKLEGSLATVVENALHSLIALGMFPILLLIMIAPSLFKVVFGQVWIEAGVYAQILGIWMFIWFISSPISTIYSVLEKQDYFLVLNIIILVTRFFSLVGGGLLGSARLALTFFSISGILTYGFQVLKITGECGVRPAKIGRLAFIYLIKFLPAGAIMMLAILLHAGDWIRISLAGIMLIVYVYFEGRNTPLIRDSLQRLWTARGRA
jgi:lipopolysaccharide exporter